MTPSALLTTAKASIEEFGWLQKEYGTTEEGFCAVGALDRHSWGSSDTYQEALRHLRRVTGYLSIVHWNDTPGRTKEEVVGAFQIAITRAKEEEVGDVGRAKEN